jgi:hypothetical protein
VMIISHGVFSYDWGEVNHRVLCTRRHGGRGVWEMAQRGEGQIQKSPSRGQ